MLYLYIDENYFHHILHIYLTSFQENFLFYILLCLEIIEKKTNLYNL
jgi:hypothetical protein